MSETLYDLVATRKRKAERLFCASILLNPSAAQRDCRWLAPEDFLDERYRRFWLLLQDGVTAVAAAAEVGILDEIIQVSPEIISTLAYRDFARNIAEEAYLLRLSKSLPDLARAISQRDLESVYQKVDSLQSGNIIPSDVIPSVLDVAFDFDRWITTAKNVIHTGIPKLDEALGGLDVPTLTLIAGRPSMGKTALGFQIARNLASSGVKTIYFSLEMSARQLWSRAACGATGIDLKHVRSGNLDEKKRDLLRQKSLELAASFEDRLLIDDSPNNTSEMIWSKVAHYKPQAILVDHTSLVNDRADSEVLRIGRIVWSGKKIAKEFGIAAIYLQQLNRGVEQRADRIPTMADLRDSGELEQTADNVIFIYRPDYYAPPAQAVNPISETQLIVAKARDGMRNIVAKVDFDCRRQWFFPRGGPYEM